MNAFLLSLTSSSLSPFSTFLTQHFAVTGIHSAVPIPFVSIHTKIKKASGRVVLWGKLFGVIWFGPTSDRTFA